VEQNSADEAKNSEIQRVVMDYLAGKVNSSRDFETKTGISHAMYGRYIEMKSIMTLDKMEQIFSSFPELKVSVGKHLGIITEEKHTPATKSDEAGVIDVLERTVGILRDENMKLLNIVELALKRGGAD
jgi:hypothetical protein